MAPAPDPDDDCPTIVHLENWRAGDERAFELLHQRLTPLLRCRVRRHRVWPWLQAQHQVDDVLQEFWVRSVDTVRERFEHLGPGSLLGYLGKLLDRQLIDIARRQRAAKRGENETHRLATNFDAPERPRPGLAAPATPTSHARVGELAAIARQELTDRELEAWDLVERQGFSATEAAVGLRTTAAAVRGLLLRCRAKLIRRLQQGQTSGD